jgi:hypothetical protein
MSDDSIYDQMSVAEKVVWVLQRPSHEKLKYRLCPVCKTSKPNGDDGWVFMCHDCWDDRGGNNSLRNGTAMDDSYVFVAKIQGEGVGSIE